VSTVEIAVLSGECGLYFIRPKSASSEADATIIMLTHDDFDDSGSHASSEVVVPAGLRKGEEVCCVLVRGDEPGSLVLACCLHELRLTQLYK
jgi:hypothetical protein